jgi:iron complex transport system substrate-binding protein
MRSRRMLAVLPLVVGSLLASSCSADETSSAVEPEAAASGGGFPVTVPHKFGETTVTEAPTRVVSVGVTEQDILLELGVVPVAVTEWYGDKPFATWPWAEDLLGDAEPEVLGPGPRTCSATPSPRCSTPATGWSSSGSPRCGRT